SVETYLVNLKRNFQNGIPGEFQEARLAFYLGFLYASYDLSPFEDCWKLRTERHWRGGIEGHQKYPFDSCYYLHRSFLTNPDKPFLNLALLINPLPLPFMFPPLDSWKTRSGASRSRRALNQSHARRR